MLIISLEIDVEYLNNIDLVTKLTSIITTLHRVFKQIANGAGNIRNKVADTDYITFEENKFLTQHAREAFLKVMREYAFEY